MANHDHDHDHDHECVACHGGPEAMVAAIESAISQYGHAVVATQTSTPAGLLSMSFTVGLSRIGLPEIAVFALPPETAQSILNDAARMARNGALLLDSPVESLVEGLDVSFKLADLGRVRLFTTALEAMAGVEPLTVWQLVWPDASGRFPWQDGFDESLLGHQPLLSSLN